MMDDFFCLDFTVAQLCWTGTLLLLPRGCHVCEGDLKCNCDVFDLCSTNRVLVFNRFACLWPNGYQRGSQGKSQQNGDYLNQAIQKSYPSIEFEPAAFGLPV